MKRTPIFGKVGAAASATHAAAGSSRSLAKLGPRSVAVAAVLSLSVLAAGCGSDDAEGSGDGSSTLTVQVQSEQLDAFQYAADIFEDENPEVKVELQTITGEQKNSTNAQVMASGDAPDIGLVPTNAAPYLELMKNDGLVPLDDVWESADLDNRMDEATAESLKSDGTPYVVLFDTVYYNVVFYNKEAFEKAGVEAPANHQLESPEQLYDIVDQLDEAGYKGVALGGSSGFQASMDAGRPARRRTPTRRPSATSRTHGRPARSRRSRTPIRGSSSRSLRCRSSTRTAPSSLATSDRTLTRRRRCSWPARPR